MREIKFKGKEIESNKVVFGSLAVCGSQCYIFDSERRAYLYNKDSTHLKFDRWSEVVPESIRQFTGLLDKNGNEIYEGDKFNLNRKVLEVSLKIGAYGYFLEWNNEFIPFAKNFKNLGGKDNQLNNVELVNF